MYTAVLFAITREEIRSGKWKKINSVAKGKVTGNNELRHVSAHVYDWLCKYEVFEQAQRRGICLSSALANS